jgi:hypothetical protein
MGHQMRSPSKDIGKKQSKEIHQACKEIIDKDLKLMMGDKSGAFGIITIKSYQTKVKEALNKNFRFMTERKTGITQNKIEVLKILRGAKMTWLAGKINTATNNWLFVFFSLKTHKINWPLRPIISENGTWIKLLSEFIVRYLGWIKLQDPFRIKNSEQIIQRFQELHGSSVIVKSYDVSDMYFAMDQGTLLTIIRNKIESQSTIEFQNKFKITVDQGISLIELFFKSTIIKCELGHFSKRNGVPIGSQAAPMMCDIYMEVFDIKVKESLKELIEEERLYIDRFVDDFETIFFDQKDEESINRAFREVGDSMKLKFTEEKVDERKQIQFLDVRIFTKQGFCFRYQQRSEKPLLSYRSHHEKSILNGVVKSVIFNAMKKSCNCEVAKAIELQVQRLIRGNYPIDLIDSIKRKMLKPKQEKQDREPENIVGIPRIHKLTHDLKKEASEFGVKVVSTYNNKLSSLPARIERMKLGKEDKECSNHVQNTFKCEKNQVYNIKLTCKSEYVGETSRCPNVRLQEHMDGVTKSAVFDHMEKCKCKIEHNECALLLGKPIKGAHSRKIVETLMMEQKVNQIGKVRLLSAPSIIPTNNEIAFIMKNNLVPTFNQ